MIVAGLSALIAATLRPWGTPTVDTMNRSGRYTTIAIASEISIARGMLRSGRFTSPPTAAIRSKPCSAMKVRPIAETSPPAPCAKNGDSPSATRPGGAWRIAQPPAPMRTAKSAILPRVSHWPPPDALRIDITV